MFISSAVLVTLRFKRNASIRVIGQPYALQNGASVRWPTACRLHAPLVIQEARYQSVGRFLLTFMPYGSVPTLIRGSPEPRSAGYRRCRAGCCGWTRTSVGIRGSTRGGSTSSSAGVETVPCRADATSRSTTEVSQSASPARASSAAGLLPKPDLNGHSKANFHHCFGFSGLFDCPTVPETATG